MLIYTNDSSLCREFAFFIAPSIVVKSSRSIDSHEVGFFAALPQQWFKCKL